MAAVVGAVLVLLRDQLTGLTDPDVLVVLGGGFRGPDGAAAGAWWGFAAEKRLGRRWRLGGIVLGTLEAALGGVLLLRTEVDPDVLVPVAAAWAVASGTLLLAEGVRLRRLVRTWRQPPGAASQGPSPASNGRDG